ncbi:Pr6Pr family membrane protein [uncultured Cyclobacterium sp.]|uniref:Pr6Pr family membrane protein n=1 Tax=uncultured Cyclobacterium sp. TaxID=453820 RepID=UPI0030EF12A4|tara:strand:- start:566191 stop:566838 length:648 start_codon:yes stop_codon:yes gene_type:complete
MNRKFETIGLFIVWFAVLAQLYLIIQHRQESVIETLIRFISFFTILTNTLVAMYFTAIIFKLKAYPFSILSSKGALTAITTFILIVGLVYQLVLRSIWQPSGLQYLVDELLHTFVPIYVFIYWCFKVDKLSIQPKNLIPWLLYPLFYLIFILARGYFSEFYPYPFLDVHEIGLFKALLNIGLIIVVTMLLFGVLMFLGKLIIRQRIRNGASNQLS